MVLSDRQKMALSNAVCVWDICGTDGTKILGTKTVWEIIFFFTKDVPQ